VLRLRGDSVKVPTGAWPTIVALALPNMVLWHLLAIVAVKMLSSGRAAILAYTMPVWAVLWGLLVFRDRISGTAWVGVGCALAGALLLMSSEFGALSGKPFGTVLMLIASISWGLGTQMMKRTRLDMPVLSLTFWMLVVTLPFLLAGTLLLESGWRMPNAIEWGAIVYNAVVVFAFCHLVWFGVARQLPPVVSSLSIMLIPVVGTFSGMWMLGESPHWQDYAAIVLILASMSTVLLKPRSA
jgi:drug/metabolite transporter (DMT)-like permease